MKDPSPLNSERLGLKFFPNSTFALTGGASVGANHRMITGVARGGTASAS